MGTQSVGGASRDRTGDLLHAMQALSQLSYGPANWEANGSSDATLVQAFSLTRALSQPDRLLDGMKLARLCAKIHSQIGNLLVRQRVGIELHHGVTAAFAAVRHQRIGQVIVVLTADLRIGGGARSIASRAMAIVTCQAGLRVFARGEPFTIGDAARRQPCQHKVRAIGARWRIVGCAAAQADRGQQDGAR